MEPITTNGLHTVQSPVPSTPTARSSALQNRITSILSASYADLEIRDALSILGERDLQNTPETRRNLRLDVQQELVECNGEIVQDFGKVADQLKRIGRAIENLNASCEETGSSPLSMSEPSSSAKVSSVRSNLRIRVRVRSRELNPRSTSSKVMYGTVPISAFSSSNRISRWACRRGKCHLPGRCACGSFG